MFLLSSFFLFFAEVPVRAQNCPSHVTALDTVQSAIADLEQGQNCLNAALLGLQFGQPDRSNAGLERKIQGLQDKLKQLESDNIDLKLEILNLQDRHKQTELDLHTAETKIETLEDRLKSDEHMIEVMPLLLAPASKPKPAVNKPKTSSGSEGKAPTAKELQAAPASKPQASVNKAKLPQGREGVATAPISKPKAPASKPKPTVDSPKDQ